MRVYSRGCERERLRERMCVCVSVRESWEKTGAREGEREGVCVCVVCGISMEIDEMNEHMSRQRFAGCLSVIDSYKHM